MFLRFLLRANDLKCLVCQNQAYQAPEQNVYALVGLAHLCELVIPAVGRV